MTRQTTIRNNIILEIVGTNDYLHQVVHQNPGSLKADSRIVRDQVNHIIDQGFIDVDGRCSLAEARDALRQYRKTGR